jgi:hypothetical protein
VWSSISPGRRRNSFLLELIRELDAAEGVDTHFKSRDAKHTPGVVGERLGQSGLPHAYRLEFLKPILDVLLVRLGILGWKQDSTAGEPGFYCIHTRFSFPFRTLVTCCE